MPSRAASRSIISSASLDIEIAIFLAGMPRWYDRGIPRQAEPTALAAPQLIGNPTAMSGHAKVERRSLRYHEAIARRLAADPGVVQRARERVQGWLRNGDVAPFYAHGWLQALDLPAADLCSFLTDPAERATAFRQVSPFAGVLTPQERWRLWAIADGDDDATAA